MPSTKLRLLKNGDRFAPHRGKPPACPDGYVRDKGDPFLFHPIISECHHRGEKAIERKCCRSPKIVMWCDLSDREITALNCMECKKELTNASKSDSDNLSTRSSLEHNPTLGVEAVTTTE